ncbi:Ribosomal RNA-processing protein 12 [Dichanthelium oligosanthes]|uniref:Ribosomal RNA-processing protein 12 n=1 Tax=Dichanthelium oligosanthes TaxID=888268 RepID=A0A1E5V7W2_9POAL|nr:Ribosomal RNA-processing protein 12 [Dichanthelium oligosanthes]
MADVDMAELPQTPRSTAGDDDFSLLDGEADLAAAILERLGGSPREDYQHLCATAAAMAQAVRDRGVDATPVAYFAAAAAALAPLARAGAGGADGHVAGALLAFLSAALPAIPAAVVRARGREVADDVMRVLEFPSTPDAGVRAGLRCLAHLISAGDRANWEAVEPLYTVILRLATDHRPKVRKQAHSCLRDVLQSFQRQAILVPASEGITRCFERFLLLAGGSSAVNAGVVEEGPKGAKEVLYILNGLKCCLPLMASKPSNTILKYFKALLDLHQPILTRSILEILNAVGESPTLQLKSDALLDLMCSLGLSVSSERKSGDEMASIARLLHVGTKKVYNQNKNICVVKLPLVFTALGDILSSEFEEARFSSVEAFKGLIDNCIDETMVSQGIAQIKARHQGLKSDPTVIEKICAILEGLLDVRCSDVWDKSFHLISVIFDKLGEFSADLLPEALKNLAHMQNLSDDDFSFRKQLNACIGSAVASMGPKNVLEILQIRSICVENEWILPILEKHIVGASLQFFLKDILGIVKAIEKSITKNVSTEQLLKDDKLFSAKRAEGYVYSLWSLLPSCCNYPCDTSSNFRILQSVLCDTLQNQPELRGIVCSSIQVLIKQNKEALSVSGEDILAEDELSKSERRAKEHYTKNLAEENLKAIRAFSSKLLEVLCSIFLTSSNDAIGLLQPAISEIASISDKDVVGKFFLDSIRKLLDATKAVNEEPVDDSSMQVETNSNTYSMTRALLLDFAASLMPGLAAKSINVLFSYVKPAIKDSDSLIQKRAYKVLSMLLKDGEFVEKNLDVLLELMISSMPCQFPSKRYRLECLYHLIVYILKDSSMVRMRDIISSFITEILLALKEANKKTRNRAYDLLIEIARACEDAGNDEKKESLHQFFGMVAGGLVSGQTPCAISAVVTGLARLTYEFSELIGVAYKLLPQTFLLMQRNNREIVKANLGFVKALVAKSKADLLHEHLKGVVEGLLSWESDTKNSFKAKVKSLIEILVKKCGLDAVKAVMPEEHMKLLTNIRKINERKMRKAKSSEDGDAMSMASGATRQSRWNHTQMFSDFGSDDDESDGPFSTQHTVTSRAASKASTRSDRRRQTDKSLLEKSIDQLTGEPLDLLDQKTVRLALKSGRKRAATDDDEEEFEMDPEGRIIVCEEREKRKKKLVSRDDKDADGKSSARSQSVKKRKTSSSGWAYTGHEYTSKKASGDLKKKDKMEPYAYWPLDRKLLNRRSDRKASARKGMASVMKVTKRLEGKSASAALSAKRTGKMKHKKSK